MLVSQLNLFKIHDVEFCHSLDQIVQHSIPELQELRKDGKIKYIGITGYSIQVLKRIVEQVEPGTIDTVLSYCHYNLFNQGSQYKSSMFFVPTC